MMFRMPTHWFSASGAADGFTPLNAFDQALLAAGVGDTNLVRMSSILPPSCRAIDPVRLPPGALVPMAYAEITSSIPGQVISAAIAVALPVDPREPGLIMEHHAAAPLDEVESHVREMARQGFGARAREVRDILSWGSEHTVDTNGAAFAGLVLWSSPDAPPPSPYHSFH